MGEHIHTLARPGPTTEPSMCASCRQCFSAEYMVSLQILIRAAPLLTSRTECDTLSVIHVPIPQCSAASPTVTVPPVQPKDSPTHQHDRPPPITHAHAHDVCGRAQSHPPTTSHLLKRVRVVGASAQDGARSVTQRPLGPHNLHLRVRGLGWRAGGVAVRPSQCGLALPTPPKNDHAWGQTWDLLS
jgi:hypothetical protein